jgi:hypothetical protein
MEFFLYEDSGAAVRLNMVSGSPSARLCTPIAYGDTTDGYVTTASDFVFEATEWWPYATTAGLPAWDTTTGLPLNGGPGA